DTAPAATGCRAPGMVRPDKKKPQPRRPAWPPRKAMTWHKIPRFLWVGLYRPTFMDQAYRACLPCADAATEQDAAGHLPVLPDAGGRSHRAGVDRLCHA